MAREDSWHGFVGPLGAYVPHDRQSMIYSGAASAGGYVGTRIALNLATSMEISKMAFHHLPSNYVRGQLVSSAVRRQAAKQVGKWTIGRGVGLVLGASPAGWALTVALVLASIPPDVRDPVTGMTSYETYLSGASVMQPEGGPRDTGL